MDAEGLGRKLLLTPFGDPRRAPEKQTVGTVSASHKMLTLQALSSSLNAGTAKRGCLGRGEAFGCPPAVRPPKRPRPFAHYRLSDPSFLHFWAIFPPFRAEGHFLFFGQSFPIFGFRPGFHSIPGGLTRNRILWIAELKVRELPSLLSRKFLDLVHHNAATRNAAMHNADFSHRK